MVWKTLAVVVLLVVPAMADQYDDLVAAAEGARTQAREMQAAKAAEMAADASLAGAQRARDAAIAALNAEVRDAEIAKLGTELQLAIGRQDWAGVSRLLMQMSSAMAARDAAQASLDQAVALVNQRSAEQRADNQAAVRENAERLAAVRAVLKIADPLD